VTTTAPQVDGVRGFAAEKKRQQSDVIDACVYAKWGIGGRILRNADSDKSGMAVLLRQLASASLSGNPEEEHAALSRIQVRLDELWFAFRFVWFSPGISEDCPASHAALNPAADRAHRHGRRPGCPAAQPSGRLSLWAQGLKMVGCRLDA